MHRVRNTCVSSISEKEKKKDVATNKINGKAKAIVKAQNNC